MSKYKVQVFEKFRHDIEIEARSEREAIRKAKQIYYSRVAVFGRSFSFKSVDFKIDKNE